MSGPVKNAEFHIREYMQPVPPAPWEPKPHKTNDQFEDDELVAVLACLVEAGEKIGHPVDLLSSGNLEGDKLSFDLPDGYYQIFVVYTTRNAKGRNDYINFLDRDSCRLLIDAVYEPHYAHYRELFGNVIAGFFSDEPPIGNVEGYMPVGPIGDPGQSLPWSKAAGNRLRKEFGSDDWERLTPYLWADGTDTREQAKIRNAYMEMVTKLVSECFSMQNGDWCREHGVEYIGHMLEDCDMNMSMGASTGHYFRGLSG